MSFKLETYAIGRHAVFIREGDAFTVAATASATNTANTANPVAWNNVPSSNTPELVAIGEIEKWEDKPSTDFKKTYRTVPGRRVLKDKIPTSNEMLYTFTTNELALLAIEIFNKSGKLAANATFFNPLGGVQPKGFLFLQDYDQNDQLHFVGCLWVRLDCKGGMKGADGSLIEPEWEAELLYNPNNIVALS